MIEKRESLRERAKKRTVKSEHKTLGFRGCLYIWLASLVAQTVKSPHAMQETQVQSLDQEDSLEKGMATHSSILGWRIPWTEESGGATVHGVAESDTTEQLSTAQGFS